MTVASLKIWMRAFGAIYRMEYSLSVVQRAQALIWSLSHLPPLIIMMIWLGLADRYGTIGGYNKAEFAAYFLFIYLARSLMVCWATRAMHDAIRSGKMQQRLLKPIDPVWPLIAEHWAEVTVRLPIILGVFFLGVWLTDIDISWSRLPFYFMAVFIGWWITFSIYYLAGMAAFWLESVIHLESLLYRIMASLGGLFIPLSFFPGVLQSILHYLPFPYTAYFATQIALGKIQGEGMVEGFGIAISWIIALTLGRVIIWRIGMRHFTAVGN